MNNLLRILCTLVCLATVIPVFGETLSSPERGGKQPALRIGLIADPQYTDADPNIGRYYRQSLPKLEQAVDDLNKTGVDFTLMLGDVADRSASDFPHVLERFGKLDNPLYCTTGNHDYKGFESRSDLFRRLGMPGEYYAFSRNGWTFVMLNTNDLSAYAPDDGEKQQEYQLLRDKAVRDKRNNTASYNGGIGKEQMTWLAETLRSAQKAGDKVVVCTHHPLAPENGFTALNDRDILAVLSQWSCVKLVLSGHHHSGGFAMAEGIPCVTLQGMVETQDQNAYGILELDDDRIVIKGKGRCQSREFAIRADSAQAS